jgi:hypothetical protein
VDRAHVLHEVRRPLLRVLRMAIVHGTSFLLSDGRYTIVSEN